MKSSHLALGALTASLSLLVGCSDGEMVVERHENGQKKSEGDYKNGKKEGRWAIWSDNGKKSSEGEFKSGELNDMWKRRMDPGP